jgi:site-specific DNA-methyltransferase (adenine-specific)
MFLPAVASGPLTIDTVHHTDLLTLCAALPDRSIDCILCDLPYGSTACHWDVIIPFAPMWAAFKRVVKPRGAIVLTASQPFTSLLVGSNLDWFKHSWVWNKSLSGNFLNMKIQPAKIHEDVIVFATGAIRYFPQMTKGLLRTKGSTTSKPDTVGEIVRHTTISDMYYPQSIINISNADRTRPEFIFHPTQKPVALFEYLIRTYTQPGDVVFDPCVGSGTTAIAARNTGRHWICGDSGTDEKTGKTWAQVAKDRLAVPFTLPLFTDTPTASPAVQMEMGL